jgi:hypothetical protein
VVGDGEAFGGAGAGSERTADPDGAFVEMRKELGAYGVAEGEVAAEDDEQSGCAEREDLVVDGPGHVMAIARREPAQDGVLPLRGALGKEEAGEHGSEDHGEDQSTGESEGDGPGHRLEEAAFNRLQREDGQVRGDDDADGVEDRALDLMRGLADLLHGGLVGIPVVAEMSNDVFNHDHRTVDDRSPMRRARAGLPGCDGDRDRWRRRAERTEW